MKNDITTVEDQRNEAIFYLRDTLRDGVSVRHEEE